MSEDYRDEHRKKGFLSWVLGEEEDEEGTAIYSEEDVGTRKPQAAKQEPHGFTVERADEIIQDMPEDVPRASAVAIVRRTLSAAGIDVEDLRRSSSRREAKLNSEIEMSQGRIKELREKTDEHVASLEQQIRKAREDRDSGVDKEEKKITRARTGIEKVERVREFFGLPKEEEQKPEQPQHSQQRPQQSSEQHQERRSRSTIGQETQAMDAVESNEETQVIRRRGPLSEEQNSGEQSSERPSSRSERRNPRGDRDR